MVVIIGVIGVVIGVIIVIGVVIGVIGVVVVGCGHFCYHVHC